MRSPPDGDDEPRTRRRARGRIRTLYSSNERWEGGSIAAPDGRDLYLLFTNEREALAVGEFPPDWKELGDAELLRLGLRRPRLRLLSG
jgi:hypothetical protein